MQAVHDADVALSLRQQKADIMRSAFHSKSTFAGASTLYTYVLCGRNHIGSMPDQNF